MIVDISKTRNYTAPQYDKIQPVLRTIIPHHRPHTQMETLLAMVKRNLNIPEIQGIVDQEMLSDMMVESFINTFIDKTTRRYMFRQYQEEYLLKPTANSLWDWCY